MRGGNDDDDAENNSSQPPGPSPMAAEREQKEEKELTFRAHPPTPALSFAASSSCASCRAFPVGVWPADSDTYTCTCYAQR